MTTWSIYITHSTPKKQWQNTKTHCRALWAQSLGPWAPENVMGPLGNMIWKPNELPKIGDFICHFYEISLHEISLQWCHNGRDGVSNQQPHNCLLNRLFKCRSKKTSKLRVTGLCAGNSPVTGEFPAQMASNAENVSIWWRHHVTIDKNVRQQPWPWLTCEDKVWGSI